MIRKATAQDIPQILQLVNKNLDKLLPRATEDYTEFLGTTWVAEHAGEVVGSCLLEVYSPKIAEIRSFVVHEEYRGRGFGKALIEAAVAEANHRNIREILVVTSSREYFERLNFGACLHEKYALFYGGSNGDGT